MSQTHAYSEIFYSMQGEGRFTGRPTAWLRLFGCNLQCEGFGQKDPTDPSTYQLPYKDFDTSSVKSMEELPVWDKGCDSSYSWSAKYKHLAHKATAQEIASRILLALPDKKFGKKVHMCFTGGEPLLPKNQRAVLDVMNALIDRIEIPKNITFETNGTREIGDLQPLFDRVKDYLHPPKFLFSVSPKLWTVSGEPNVKAIKPDAISSYLKYGDVQLKFVMGKDPNQWKELDHVLTEIDRQNRGDWLKDIWIMPVGATQESQEDIAGEVANMALQRGFSVSARVHCYLWGNVIGV